MAQCNSKPFFLSVRAFRLGEWNQRNDYCSVPKDCHLQVVRVALINSSAPTGAAWPGVFSSDDASALTQEGGCPPHCSGKALGEDKMRQAWSLELDSFTAGVGEGQGTLRQEFQCAQFLREWKEEEGGEQGRGPAGSCPQPASEETLSLHHFVVWPCIPQGRSATAVCCVLPEEPEEPAILSSLEEGNSSEKRSARSFTLKPRKESGWAQHPPWGTCAAERRTCRCKERLRVQSFKHRHQ